MEFEFIYALRDPATRKIRYIGKTNNLSRRYYSHLNDKKKSPKVSWLKSLRNKNITPEMVIIGTYSSDIIYEMEIFWISYFSKISKLTNISKGGKGGCSKRSQETRTKISNTMKSVSKSKEHCDNISKATKGIKRPDRTAANLKEYWNNQETKGYWAGKKRAPASNETREKLSKSNKHVRKVAQYTKKFELVKVWNSIIEAKKTLGPGFQGINGSVNKENRSAGGYVWQYI